MKKQDIRLRVESDDKKTSVRFTVSDIKERKRAGALRESEWKYRIVADFTYDWEFWLAPDGNYVYVSPSCERITGYTPDEFYASPQLMTEIIHPDDKKMAVGHLTGSMTIGVAKPIEFRVIVRDGTQRWISHVCQPVYDSDGNLLGQRGSNRDITESRRIKEALRESEAKYRSIFESAKEGICQIDEDFNITLLNQRMADMLGYTVEEIQGHSVSDFILRCDMQDLRQPDAGHGQNLLERFDWCLRRKDGSEIWAIISGKPVMAGDDQLNCGVAMITDITERKLAENALRNASLYTRSLIEASLDPLVTIGYDGKITDVNKATESVTGYSREELIGSNFADYFTEPEKAEAGYNRVFETGSVRDYELNIRHKNGNITPVLYNASVYRDESGSIIGVFAAARDITERKHIEKMLRQSGERYRTFIESMSEGFVVFNKNMEVAYANEKFCRMIGYEKEEIIGTSILDRFDKDNQNIVKEQFMKRSKGEFTPYQVESVCKDGSGIFLNISPKPVFDSENAFQGSFAVINDITPLVTEQQAMKTQIKTTMTQIEHLNRENQDYNYALKVLLKNNQNEQKAVEEKIVSNVREMVLPFLEKLKKTRLSETQKLFLDVVEKNLNDIISPFASKLKSEMRDFTPMEIQVANLVREGKSNTEIGDILGISEYTAMFHRRNIREKLGLKHQKTNLRTYLLSLST